MRIATITWISHYNYGTYLQAYALQQIIFSLGHNNSIIDDFRIVNPNILRRFLGRLKRFFWGWKIPNHNSFQQFRKTFLKIDKHTTSLRNLNYKYDLFVCGSDQIWFPKTKLKLYYFGDFCNKKIISYAASTGKGSCDTNYMLTVGPLLSRFSHISVREDDGAKMLSSFVNKDIEVVLDPTLLLTEKQWSHLLLDGIDCKDAIVCYFLTPNQWYIDFAVKYAKQYQKKLYIFNSISTKMVKGVADKIISGGPQEFLSYIKSAGIILTDSYHASLFGIIFHKRFLTFKRFSDDAVNNQNSRILNLFGKIGITECLCDEKEAKRKQIPLIDYYEIDNKILTLRKHSIDFLNNSIIN